MTSPRTPADKTVAGVFSSDEDLQAVAKRLRRHIVTMIARAGSGHPGGSLSAVEIATALFWRVMRHKPAHPQWPDRDRFILSKGHAAPLLYAVLAECGYFPVSELNTLRQIDSHLQGHADRTSTPGVEMSSGSLGQGLSFAVGCGLAGRLNSQDYRVYALLSDGECDEGQTWEAAMAAAHFKIDNLTAIVDHNGLQLSGFNKDIMNLEPLPDKFAAFGWRVSEVDGHDFTQLLSAIDKAKRVKGQPAAIIAHTVKGKGVSFMENNVDFHGKAPNAEQLEKALKELS
ncbi:MAG: transketolase [Chloroflexi bacterium RBG_16_58_8]|nr:MAG: transketolase [Chloroflexi bacterium RBG_16_58_8]